MNNNPQGVIPLAIYGGNKVDKVFLDYTDEQLKELNYHTQQIAQLEKEIEQHKEAIENIEIMGKEVIAQFDSKYAMVAWILKHPKYSDVDKYPTEVIGDSYFIVRGE